MVIRCVELCPQALNRPDLHFEGAVVITWIGREDELYSGASPISLVEHCVTFRHDRRLLSLLGFVHNWPTSRWIATKKENWFSLNGNGIMSSFLGRQFIVPLCILHTSCVSVLIIVIYEALCFDVAQGRMNGAPNETRTHSCRFANHYTTKGNLLSFFCLDVAQDRMNWAPNENRTHSCRFTSLPC